MKKNKVHGNCYISPLSCMMRNVGNVTNNETVTSCSSLKRICPTPKARFFAYDKRSRGGWIRWGFLRLCRLNAQFGTSWRRRRVTMKKDRVSFFLLFSVVTKYGKEDRVRFLLLTSREEFTTNAIPFVAFWFLALLLLAEVNLLETSKDSSRRPKSARTDWWNFMDYSSRMKEETDSNKFIRKGTSFCVIFHAPTTVANVVYAHLNKA